MTAASFGGLLKDFRIRKGLTQNDIAFAMGWSEPSRLSRIEQGKTKKPTRKTVDTLIHLMKLDRNEKGQLLLAGGYLPTEEEILAIRNETQKILDKWEYPAYMLDFSWRLIAINHHASEIYNILNDDLKWTLKSHPNALEFAFHKDFPQNKYLKDEDELFVWNKVLLGKLVRFRLNNRNHTSENWYQQFFQKMMKNKLFVTIWKQAQKESEEVGIANYEQKILVDYKNPQQRFNFHIFRSPLLQDVRFEINFHIAGDIKTHNLFKLDRKT